MKHWPHSLNSFLWQDIDSIFGNTQLTVIRITKLFLLYLLLYFAKMWYEILPSAFIITAALGLPGWGLYHIHNLTLGNHFRRTLDDRWDRQLYQRDLRLTGNPYDVNGLEKIPDN